jgi:hypothetical protein
MLRLGVPHRLLSYHALVSFRALVSLFCLHALRLGMSLGHNDFKLLLFTLVLSVQLVLLVQSTIEYRRIYILLLPTVLGGLHRCRR